MIIDDEDFRGTVFQACAMADVTFDDVNMEGGSFVNTTMTRARFTDLDLSSMKLDQINAQRAAVQRSTLQYATIDDVDMSDTVFTNVNLQRAKFRDINLSGVVIDDANIEGLTIMGHDIQALIAAKQG
ncbi:pentapeptide repeat-containing protein [Novosphingobium sp.]|uniref:pentapeptide repeat-containing protein n=1 Tax=Novosphingobium sp. TaxID=1874826 RepID=UPI003B522E7A